MADYEVNQAIGGVGPSGGVMHTSVATVSDGDTYDTGLSEVDTVVGIGTTADTNVTVSSIDGGVVTFNVQTGGAAATDEEVHIIAVGDR